MYYSININQIAIAEFNKHSDIKLDLIDGCIIEYLHKQSTSVFAKKNFLVHDDQVYYRVCYDNIILQLPLLNIETKDAIGRRLKKLTKCGIILFYYDRDQGNKTYFTITEIFESFFSFYSTFKPNPSDFQTEPLPTFKPNHIDNVINDNNININTSTTKPLSEKLIYHYFLGTIKSVQNIQDVCTRIENVYYGSTLSDLYHIKSDNKEAIDNILSHSSIKKEALLTAEQIINSFKDEIEINEAFFEKFENAVLAIQKNKKSDPLYLKNFLTTDILNLKEKILQKQSNKADLGIDFIQIKDKIVQSYQNATQSIKMPDYRQYNHQEYLIYRDEISKKAQEIELEYLPMKSEIVKAMLGNLNEKKFFFYKKNITQSECTSEIYNILNNKKISILTILAYYEESIEKQQKFSVDNILSNLY